MRQWGFKYSDEIVSSRKYRHKAIVDYLANLPDKLSRLSSDTDFPVILTGNQHYTYIGDNSKNVRFI